MAMLNIPTTCQDPKYSYKMPQLITKVEGRGNSIKTCIVNIGDVARALARPPQYTTKWFGNELGADATYAKDRDGERSFVSGFHETAVIQSILDEFIDKYVCCPSCHLPEIEMSIQHRRITGKCKACDWQGALDNEHKVASFITKHPPDKSGLDIVGPEGKKLNKEERRKEKLRKKAELDSDGESTWCPDSDEEDSVGSSKRDKKEKKEKKEKKDKKEKKEKKDKKEKKEKERREHEEKEEKKEKKEKKDKKEKKGKKDKKEEKEEKESQKGGEPAKDKDAVKPTMPVQDSDAESTAKESDDDFDNGSCSHSFGDSSELEYYNVEAREVIGKLSNFVQSKGGEPSVAELIDEVQTHQDAKGFDQRVCTYVVLEALFGDGMSARAMREQKLLVEPFTPRGSTPTTDLLWALDMYLEAHPTAEEGFFSILRVLYDEDWADEREMVAYYNEDQGVGEPGFEAGKAAAAPFIKWLKTAESDSEDEDELG